MGVKHIHRDAVRAGEIHEKKDLTKNPLLMKIQDQERAKKAAGGGNGGGGNVGPGQGRRVGGGNDLDSIVRDRGYDSVGRRGGRDVSVGNRNGMNPSAAGRNKPNADKGSSGLVIDVGPWSMFLHLSESSKAFNSYWRGLKGETMGAQRFRGMFTWTVF